MGRHAAPGSDGTDRGVAPASGGRRRTDGPGAPSLNAGASDLSDHPTTPGRRRSDRRLNGGIDPAVDLGRQVPGGVRPGLDPRAPQPTDTPVAARRRPPVPPPLRPVRTGPRTTMAPFQAVPSPQAEQAHEFDHDRPLPVAPPAAGPRVAAPPAAAPQPATAPPAAARRRATDLARPEDDRTAPRSTGPSGAHPSAPPYGDWTRPSRGGTAEEEPRRPEMAVPAELAEWLQAAQPDEEPAAQRPARPAVANPFSRLQAHAEMRVAQEPITAPETTAIPEREVSRGGSGRDRAEAPPADHDEPMTGTIGGRAASRAERQAKEEARRKAARKGGGAPNRTDDGGPRRSPRRMALGLVAVAVVALGVLGVYSFASPDTKASSAQNALSNTATPPPITGALPSDLPAITTGGISGSAVPTSAAPIRVPVTVLNSTKITGLAASISGAVKNAGWPAGPVGEYANKDVAATTVFFTQGDENQRQAALQLIEQFPQVQGPAPRFFDMPAGAPPGLVIVATGDWKP